MPPISVLMKPASSLCNMSCDYCFYCDEAEKRSRRSYGLMSEQTLKNIIRKTIQQAEGAISYAYQGGEPTLRGLDFFKQAIRFQNQYNRKQIKVYNAFQTNGYGLTEEWCEFFQQNHFLVGISLDGTREIHNAYRHGQDGSNTYDRVLQSTKLLDQYGVEYNILTVVNQKVANDIREIYENYRTQGWKYQQYIACLDPLGEPHGERGYALTPEKYGEFLIELFDLWYMDWKKGQQPYIRQFDNYAGILAGYCPEACEQRGICGNHFVAEANGDVYPCDFYMLDDFWLGNFNQNRLAEIEEMRKKSGFIERSKQISEKCRECKYYKICRGGCQRNRYRKNDGEGYENIFCEGYQMFFHQCMDRLEQVSHIMYDYVK